MQKYYPDWSIFGVSKEEPEKLKKLNRLLIRFFVKKRQELIISQQNTLAREVFPYVKEVKEEDLTFSNEPQKQGTFGQVANGTYMGQKVVVKRVKHPVHSSVFLMEAIIQIILHNYTEKEDCAIRVPRVYKFAKCKFPRIITLYGKQTVVPTLYTVLIMQAIEGDSISKYINVEKHLTTIVDGLEQLQSDLSFVHRDLHAGNIIIEKSRKKEKKAFIIDFGKACIGNPEIEVKNGMGKTVVQNYYDFVTNCTNKSHDVCCLILNLVSVYNKKRLEKTAEEICNAYKEKVSQSPSKMYDENSDLNGYHWKDKIFHWYYATLLEDIELKEYIPEKLIKERLVCRLRF